MSQYGGQSAAAAYRSASQSAYDQTPSFERQQQQQQQQQQQRSLHQQPSPLDFEDPFTKSAENSRYKGQSRNFETNNRYGQEEQRYAGQEDEYDPASAQGHRASQLSQPKTQGNVHHPDAIVHDQSTDLNTDAGTPNLSQSPPAASSDDRDNPAAPPADNKEPVTPPAAPAPTGPVAPSQTPPALSPSLGPVAPASIPQPQLQPGNSLQPNTPSTNTPKSNYHPTDLNALYYMSAAAKTGFTREHMQSFIHLGIYALGSLDNSHGLAPGSEPGRQ